jgi:hypothetical protein
MMGSPPGPPEERASAKPILVAWVLLAGITTLPYLSAALYPPRGRAFAGTFHWIDDFHNYVSFVQQAEDGRFLFENKLVPEESHQVLVNLEWWVVGTLSKLCGRRPFLAYRLFAVLALGGLLLTADRALRRGGLPPSHRLAALLLVGLGGGLGGLLFTFTERPVFRSADLSVGIFPFLEALANPHWVAGTWLLAASLLAFEAASGTRGWLLASLLGTVLSLVRPYDFAILGVVLTLGVLVRERPGKWALAAAPLLGLLPACLYAYWVYYRSGAFDEYGATPYAMAPASDLAWGVGPALALALLSLRGARPDARARRLHLDLWLWALVALLVALVRPVTFAQQFLIGLGFPLLVLAALGLARFRPGLTAVAALLMASTALVALRIVFGTDPNWHVPRERREAALALRPLCRPGDVVFAPGDIGLYTIALTSCKAYLSHSWAPDHARRAETVRAFYGAASPEDRAAILDRVNASRLVLPGEGDVARTWLGPGTAFTRAGGAGAGTAAIGVYARPPAPGAGRTNEREPAPAPVR